jgi:hypothetical protein
MPLAEWLPVDLRLAHDRQSTCKQSKLKSEQHRNPAQQAACKYLHHSDGLSEILHSFNMQNPKLNLGSQSSSSLHCMPVSRLVLKASLHTCEACKCWLVYIKAG